MTTNPEFKEVKQERKSYLVENGGASMWVDETAYLHERDLPQTTWKPVLKDGEPVCKVVSSKTVKMVHLVSADGGRSTWSYASDMEEKLQAGWKLAPPADIKTGREDQSNGKQK